MIDARVFEQPAIEVARSRRSPPLVRAAIAAFCACWALASGCAARPATWRSVTDQRWLELRSEAFIMATDLPRLTALERFREVEDAYHTVLDHLALVSAGPRPRVQPFRIVHLARCSDLARTPQRTVAASVTEPRDFSGTRLIVTCDETRERRAAFLHEMIHVLTAAHFTRLPPWLVEGLAAYYQTLLVEDSSIVIGTPPPGHSNRPRYSGFPDALQRHRYSGAPDVETLRSMTEAFYKGAVYYNYVGAWRFVHLLNSPPHRARFVAYLRSLHAGASPDDAWSAAFGDIDSDRIAAQYAHYAKRTHIPRYRVRRRARAAFREPDIQALRPGEVHALWIRLYMAAESPGDSVVREAVREHLAAAAREDPRWTGVTFWRAVQAYHADSGSDRVQAERLLRSHAAREPRDFRAWAGLVTIGIGRAVPPDYLGVGGAVPAGLAGVEPDVRELLRSAGTAHSLDLVGRYYALRRLPRTGLAFAFRAVQADPACGACHDTLALLLFQDGRVADSVSAQERAVALQAEERPDRAAERRLEIYRRAQRDRAATSR